MNPANDTPEELDPANNLAARVAILEQELDGITRRPDGSRECLCGNVIAGSGWGPHRAAHLKAARAGKVYAPGKIGHTGGKTKKKAGRPKGTPNKPKPPASDFPLPRLTHTLMQVVEVYAGPTIPVERLSEVLDWMVSTEHLFESFNPKGTS